MKEFGAHGEDFRYYVKVFMTISVPEDFYDEVNIYCSYFQFSQIKCSQCGEVSDKFHYLCASDTVPTKTGRSTVNLLGKCKSCSREWSISKYKMEQCVIRITAITDRQKLCCCDCFAFRHSS